MTKCIMCKDEKENKSRTEIKGEQFVCEKHMKKMQGTDFHQAVINNSVDWKTPKKLDSKITRRRVLTKDDLKWIKQNRSLDYRYKYKDWFGNVISTHKISIKDFERTIERAMNQWWDSNKSIVKKGWGFKKEQEVYYYFVEYKDTTNYFAVVPNIPIQQTMPQSVIDELDKAKK